MTFHIGSQSGVVNNVGGDQTIYGGQHAPGSLHRARAAVATLQDEVSRAGLPEHVRAATQADLASIESELRRDTPDRERLGTALRHTADALAGVGAIAGAGSAVVGPLAALATWVGPRAAPVLHLLGLA